MFPFHGKNNRFTCHLRDRLKTTGMGLGLVRLQMDVGLTEEARTTLASLQDDLQLLLHGVENPMEILAGMPLMDLPVVERPLECRQGVGEARHFADEAAEFQGSFLGWAHHQIRRLTRSSCEHVHCR